MPAEETATDALRSALRTLNVGATFRNPEPLRDLVCAVVTQLKSEGVPPEHVVRAIKDIAYEANMQVVETGLLDQMIKWCIDAYFEAAD
jgi:hypothetical protein